MRNRGDQMKSDYQTHSKGQGDPCHVMFTQPIHNLGARGGFVVSKTTRPFYPRERPGANCTGGRVGLDRLDRPGLDGHGKLAATGIQSPDLQDRSESLY